MQWHSQDLFKKKAQVKTSRQQKDKLGSPVLPKFGVVEPNCCKYKTVVSRPKAILQNFGVVGPTVVYAVSCIHSVYFDILCIHLTCCGARGTSEKIFSTYNRQLQGCCSCISLRRKATCSCIVKTCLKRAQVKASRQQITNLAVHYPPKFGVVETNCCIYKNCRISPEGCIYQTAVSRPEIYRTAVSRPKSPPVRIVRVVPLSLGKLLGLSNRHDGQGSMRHHAELWDQRLQNGCTGESIKI